MREKLLKMLLRSRTRQSQGGAALVLIAMAAVVILFSVVVAHSQLQSRTTESSLQLRNDVQSRDVARSGVELALQQLRDNGAGTVKFTSCKLNSAGLPQFERSTYDATLNSPDTIPLCPSQRGTEGPRALVIGGSCVTWWFGIVDEVNQTVQVHVSSVAPYVSRTPAEGAGTCSLEGLADGGGVINSQGGVTYTLTAAVSTWTAIGRPSCVAFGNCPAGETYANPCTGSIASPCIMSISYDKRTFNL